MKLSIIECYDLPEKLDENSVYRILPKNFEEKYYWERVDRNIGWITKDEQEILRKSSVGVAGCGGMGGQLAEKFLRLGVGEIRISDCELFDVSNINRQFGASRSTVGKSKALETAKMLRAVSDDFQLIVYPQGICEETANEFISGCDVVCDEIEFWAIAARILLHMEARKRGVPVFNCNTIGFSTRLFFFADDGATMEDCLGLNYQEAKHLQNKIYLGKATDHEKRKVMDSVLKGLLPEFPEYCNSKPLRNRERLLEERKAPIIATNPPLATGFLADHVLLYLLRNSSVKREVVKPPKMPGYLHFDAAKMEAKVVTGKWW